MDTSSQRLTNALIVSGLAAGTAYVAYKYAGLDRKIALYGALGIIGGSLAIAELGTLSDSLPYLFAGGAALAVIALVL